MQSLSSVGTIAFVDFIFVIGIENLFFRFFKFSKIFSSKKYLPGLLLLTSPVSFWHWFRWFDIHKTLLGADDQA